VVLRAAVGDDAAASAIEALLRSEGIEPGGLVHASGSTDRTTVFVTPNGQNAIVTAAIRAQSLDQASATAAVGAAREGDLLLLQGNLSLEVTRACASAARERRVLVVLNPSPIAFDFTELWPLVDIVVLNVDELASLAGDDDTVSAAHRLLGAGVMSVVITRGSLDTLLVDGTGERLVPVRPVTAVDTTGAGDAFCGTFVAGLDQGLDAIAAVERGIAVAERVVARPGAVASYPRADEMAP
jgi:ribokinase